MAGSRPPVANKRPKADRAALSGPSPGPPSQSGQLMQQQRQQPSDPLRPQPDTFTPGLLPQQSGTDQQHRAAKVAIPRLRRDEPAVTAAPSAFGEKSRVSHACEPCRQRKTKCSGEKPTCKHCSDCRIVCVYLQGKRIRTRKEIGTMAGKLDEYEKILRELSLRVDEADQLMIQKSLDHELTLDEDETSSATSSRRIGMSAIYGGMADGNFDEADGEKHVSARVGSTDSLDHVGENFDQSTATRATGYMGKNSELTWIQRLKRQTEVGSDGSEEEAEDAADVGQEHPTPFGDTSQPPINESTYHCDDLSVLIAEYQISEYDVPPKYLADLLFQAYLDTVHPAFPIIGKITFSDQYRTFYGKRVKAGAKWLAILNLIFAIGARYAYLVQAEWSGDENQHLVYFTRARMLGYNPETLFEHPSLQQVQIAGLMAFYLTAINQINRAWTFSGIAIRYACALGLNLQNQSKKVSDGSKEIRYRVWWAVCSHERLLSVMTGRATCFAKNDCSVPLPIPYDEESFISVGGSMLNSHAMHLLRRGSSQDSHHLDQTLSTPSSNRSFRQTSSPMEQSPAALQNLFDANSTIHPNQSLYFLYGTTLSVLTDEVLNRLYRASAMNESWADTQLTIGAFVSRIEEWRSALPPVFDFTKKPRDQQFIRQRMSLGFFYYSSLIIITRPCLCRIDDKVPHQSLEARNFNRATAARCVHAAKDMLGMLPNEPNSIGLCKVAPWWCSVHHLVQAATVSMLELSYRAHHLPQEAEEIWSSAKKAVSWLRNMSEEDLAAHRAWKLCDNMLRKIAPKVGQVMEELPINVSKFSHPPSGHMPNPFSDLSGQDGLPDHESVHLFKSNFYSPSHELQNASLQPYTYMPFDEVAPAQGTDPSPDFISMFGIPNQMDGIIPEDCEG